MSQETVTPIEKLAEDFMHDPWELYARFREDGPAREVVMPHGVKVWLVTRYDDVRMLLADPRISKDGHRVNEMFAKHSGAPAPEPATAETAETGEKPEEPEEPSGGGFDDDLTAHMLNTDPPVHTRLRKLVGAAFTTQRVERLKPRIRQIADELLARMAGRDKVELVDEYAAPLSSTVIAELIGVPESDRTPFRDWVNTLVGSGHSAEEVENASAQVIAYSEKLIAMKRESPGEDLLSALVQASDDGDRLTKGELVAMMFILVVAGHETTMNMLGNGTYSLLKHPDQLHLLLSEPSLMHDAVEELLRYDGAVSLGTFRFTTEEIALDGLTIPAGEILALSLGSANRDPAKFPDPDRLDIARKLTGNLAFGHGVHRCVGAPLGRVLVEIGLDRLLRTYPRLELAGTPQELAWKNSTLMHGLVTLPLRMND
ncbi:cytochrome P450 family protein [Labedaea rhizosphaerae]|uniref:Cytochrome P450 n=1 Tax=Labedaea rhizosphaerae TaxID=598644 RepID=A0A4V6PVT8_LABRH|nr:cytochrome P450 [Labedaea rhizosphaerae]TDP97338.1 cytochrome P450 [Labedaea rhizosphaerae]